MGTATSELLFGAARLDLTERRLLINDVPARLGARAFDVLVALVERRDRVVGKNELFELIWPGVVVEENNLQVHISALRKLLGPNAIKTIPGRGYRFTARLTASVNDAATSIAGDGLSAATQPDPLYGRAEDLSAISDLLHERPLVSIVGAAGIGKTRLAQALALAQRERFPGGIWWVDFSQLSDGAAIPAAIAQTLGVLDREDRPVLETVIALLRNGRSLLILDNCEHVVDDAANCVRTLLVSAPELRVVATSQEPLRLPAEQAYRLGGLESDSAAQTPPAVELFVARARAADPRLQPTSAQLVTIADICRRLDGMPLAIELAAARVRLLGIDGVRARLDQRFDVLTGGTRSVLRRHQTLRAALEWSYNLCSADEQVVFRRLGVFVGGFNLELGQQVAADDRIDRWAVLDMLGNLVDKSLVIAEGDEVPRYRLLETMRAFALEELAEAGETPALLRRHAEVLLDFLGPLNEKRHLLTQAERVQCGAELDNLRTALAWAESPVGDRTLGCALIAASIEVWWIRERRLEGVERALRLLPPPAGLTPQIEAGFSLTLAALGSLGARKDCFVASLRAVELYRSLHDDSALLEALCWSAMIGCWRGETSHAIDAIAEAETLVGPNTSPRQQAALAVATALSYAYQNRHEQALECELRQAARYRDEGNEWGVQIALGNAAIYECGLGRFDSAIERLRGVLETYRRTDAPYGARHALVLLAAAYGLRGDRDEALTLGREAVPHSQRIGLTTWMLLCIALAHARHSDHARATCLAGYFDATYARVGRVASPLETMSRDEIKTRVLAALSSAEFDRYTALGSTMSEESAIAVAFDTDCALDD